MTSLTPAGMLAIALFAGSLTLVAKARSAPPAAEERVQLEVAGVLPMSEGRAGILVLREKGKERILPLVVPDGRELAPDAPSRGGLLGRALEALGAHVAEVELEEAEETAAGARVRLTQEGRRVEIVAVPSQSIALAVAARAPIVARRRLLDESALTPDELVRAHKKATEPDATRL